MSSLIPSLALLTLSFATPILAGGLNANRPAGPVPVVWKRAVESVVEGAVEGSSSRAAAVGGSTTKAGFSIVTKTTAVASATATPTDVPSSAVTSTAASTKHFYDPLYNLSHAAQIGLCIAVGLLVLLLIFSIYHFCFSRRRSSSSDEISADEDEYRLKQRMGEFSPAVPFDERATSLPMMDLRGKGGKSSRRKSYRVLAD